MTTPEQVGPGVWHIRLPLARSRTSEVNAYAITSGDGLVLIDCGWDAAATFDSLLSNLATIGATAADIRQVLITHAHADHYGAAGRLGDLGAGRVRLHPGDDELARVFSDTRELGDRLRAWTTRHGVPPEQRDALVDTIVGISERMSAVSEREALRGGERIATDVGDIEVIASPGHTDGHVVFLLEAAGLLFTGDHLLPRIYPNVSTQPYSAPDPLGRYLDSMRSLRESHVAMVLPGHGDRMPDLRLRADEILAYHDARLAEVGATLGPVPISAYEIATRCRWSGGRHAWTDLSAQERRHSLFATLARAERLAAIGIADELNDRGVVRFRLAPGS